jgi:hypothetical protein
MITLGVRMYLSIRYLLAIFIFLIFCSFGFHPNVLAKTKKDNSLTQVEGKGCFVYGDHDTPASAKEKALMLARRDAIESHKTFIRAKSSIDKFELKVDIIDTLAAGYLYKTKILDVAEDGREICVSIEAYVNPIEIDNILAKGGKQSIESKSIEIYGEWEAFDKRPSKSHLIKGKDHSVTWKYHVPKIVEDTYAGIGMYMHTVVSMYEKKVLISLESKNDFPIHIRFFSFVPGYSKKDDDNTYVPVEASVHLVSGFQEVLLEPSLLQIPEWWLEEKGNPHLDFSPKNIQIIEFEAQVDEDIGPVSDTIKIQSILLQ